jgi:hypothetical protein
MPRFKATAIEVINYEIEITAESQEQGWEILNAEGSEHAWIKVSAEHQITGIEDITIEDAVIVEESNDGE